MNKARDIALILLAVVIAVAVLIPSQDKETAESDDTKPTADPAEGRTGTQPASSSAAAVTTTPAPTSTPHRLVPLIKGAKWTYHVSGPSDIINDKNWIMQLDTLPADQNPGIATVGFEGQPTPATRHVWLEGVSVRTDALPFVEPLEYLNNPPSGVEGHLFPVADGFVKGVVWNQLFSRSITYQYRDKRGRPKRMPATAVQKDRAEVEELEDITVPAGRFKAVRIHWLSRFEVKAQKRQVLDALTGAPYRKETMWVAPHVGIIQRRIEYLGVRAGRINFDLISFTYPNNDPK